MSNIEDSYARLEKMCLILGSLLGQLHEILNSFEDNEISNKNLYIRLLALHEMGSQEVTDLFYKEHKNG